MCGECPRIVFFETLIVRMTRTTKIINLNGKGFVVFSPRIYTD
jgi:hypothetical protein